MVTLPADLVPCLEPAAAALPDPGELRFAAVIALLLRDDPHQEDPRLLLIERSGTLRTHAGQVAFPGGKPEPTDAHLMETALREAEEEVGLPSQSTTVLGRLRPVPTPSGFLVMPFVGWAPVGWAPCIASPEVEQLITPQLGRLADPAVHRTKGRREWRGHEYVLHEFAVHDPPVWGATALMVWELLGRLRLREGPLWP